MTDTGESRSPAEARPGLGHALALSVLDVLEPGLREFLTQTSVLAVLDAAACDQLLERTGSEALLNDLERRGVLSREADGPARRYRLPMLVHEALIADLTECVGPAGIWGRYRRAGKILEAAGDWWGAAWAFAQAEDAEALDRLANRRSRNDGAAQGPAHDARLRNGATRSEVGQNGAGQNGAGQNGAGRNGARQNGAGQNGAGQNGTGHNAAVPYEAAPYGAGHNGAGHNGAGHNGAGHNGAARNGAADHGGAPNGVPREEPDARAVETPGRRRRAPREGRRATATTSGIAPTVAVRLLGTFEIAEDGDPVDLSALRPRVRAVLQYLALHADTYVHRDVLASVLWPEADLETGRRGVQVAVSALRSALQPGRPRRSTLLPRRGDAYMLALVAHGSSDVVDLDAQLGRARRARGMGDLATAVDAWREVSRLYRGELLLEQGNAEWVVAERDRLRMAAADALELLGRALVSTGAAGEGIDALRRALDLDPFRDGTWRTLAETHEAQGDASAAAAARHRHRRVLVDLGVLDDAIDLRDTAWRSSNRPSPDRRPRSRRGSAQGPR